MSEQPALDPLVVEFDVAAPRADAFELWVAEAHRWWPRDHTMSGSPAAIVFEERPGGRIYERGDDGTEHEWGEVLDWDPPGRLRCLWHLFFARSEATEVELSFDEIPGGTRVRIVQTGWDALGAPGAVRRERTGHGWRTVTAGYRQLLDHPNGGNR